MDHMKRLRKTGSFYKRAKKYMVSDPVNEKEAGSSTVVLEAQNETETAEYLDLDPAEEEEVGTSGAG
uniref:Uncharacterized protein n=1 Tax=Anopheles atroparvus TaxID=41427 RepID=A0AAG5DRU0_ANOAO